MSLFIVVVKLNFAQQQTMIALIGQVLTNKLENWIAQQNE